jgi:AcrR family transcriptional regulator
MAEQQARRRRQARAAGGTSRGSARDRLLKAAAECFYNHGVTGTGIDAITAAAGVAKMSLYNNFASKDDLVLAYLQARHEEWLDLYQRRLATAADARAGIGAVFDAYIDHAEMAYQHGFRGCGLLNAAAELPAGAPGRALVRGHKEDVQALLATHIADLGTVAPERVAPLAEQLAFTLEGAVARAGLAGSADLLHHARDLALQVVDAATDGLIR